MRIGSFVGGTGQPGAAGPAGPPGPTGATGATGPAGADALWNFTGAYNVGASYQVGDVATYNGQTWYRIHANGGNTGDTPVEGTFWTLIAEKGATGATGATGTTGSAGSNGQGVPTGGTADQVLAKIDGTNYNTHWVTNNLNGLSDVTITGTPNDKQLIVYDTATGQWKNQNPIVSTGLAYKELYPNSKTATGTLGEICIDGANGTLYICTGTNTWQKVSLNSANFTNTGGFD